MTDSLYTTDDAKEKIGVSHWVLYTAIRAGNIARPARQLGRTFVWSDSEIETAKEYFEKRKATGKRRGTNE